MTITKSIAYVFFLLLFPIVIGLDVQAQSQPNRNNTRHDSNQSFRLTESELTQLIQQIENGGDKFRVSLTDAFDRRPYDRTRSEGNMNDDVRGFKKATDQLRIRFDARQLVSDDVQRLLDQAQPIDKFIRDNPVTERARSDWSTLRTNINLLASAYNISPSWVNTPSSQTGYIGTNRLTGTF